MKIRNIWMTICHGSPWCRNVADDHCPFSIRGWWLFFYPLSYLTLTYHLCNIGVFFCKLNTSKPSRIKKTDRHDAKWIANLFRFDIVKAFLYFQKEEKKAVLLTTEVTSVRRPIHQRGVCGPYKLQTPLYSATRFPAASFYYLIHAPSEPTVYPSGVTSFTYILPQGLDFPL